MTVQADTAESQGPGDQSSENGIKTDVGRPLLIPALAFVAAVLIGLTAGVALIGGPESLGLSPAEHLWFVAICIGLGLGGLGAVVDRQIIKRAATLAAEARLAAHGPGLARVGRCGGDLRTLAQAINEVLEKLAAARTDTERVVSASTARIAEQSERLAAVLRDLHEGVLVCNLKHQILLYNQTALHVLQWTGEMGLGRNLLHIVLPEPLLHTLEHLRLAARGGTDREDGDDDMTAGFIGGTADGRVLLQGRMSLIRQGGGDGTDDALIDGAITGYVVTFRDATHELAVLGQRDALLRQATEELRPPVANLRVMLETLAEQSVLSAENRANFERAMMTECNRLTDRLETISAAYRGVAEQTWPMSDIHSSNLFQLVARRVAARSGYRVVMTGLPQQLHGDSHSLVLLLDELIGRVGRATGIEEFDLAAERTDKWVFVDLAWPAERPIPSADIDHWLRDALAGALGGLSLGDVLQHHRSEIWCETWRDGLVRLRVPLPPAMQPQAPGQRRTISARPEFFDFSLLEQPLATEELRRRPLRDLSYVVFDTETTGLSPSEGDEIVAIAAVRVVKGRILTGETFNALVNPQRPIRPESTRIHGITDAMVADRPAAAIVVPQFHAFAADSVLVAHNAAFDLKFLKMKEPETGLRFTNPVLDTMLLSVMLQGDGGDHTLDGIAERLGIDVVDRHTALGDALVTAGVFVGLLGLLEESDYHTLRDVQQAANMVLELRAREQAF